MTCKTFSILATAGLIALGGVAVGAGPAGAADTKAFTCPAGQHVISMGGVSDCAPDASGGGTGGDIVFDGGGGTCPANTTRVFTGSITSHCATNPDPTCPSGQRWHSVGPGMGYCESTPKVTPSKPAPVKHTPVKTVPTVKAGTVLKAVQTGWAKGTKFKFQWLRNGTAISKATAATFKARMTDRGARLSVRVTGTRWGHPIVKVGTAYLVH